MPSGHVRFRALLDLEIHRPKFSLSFLDHIVREGRRLGRHLFSWRLRIIECGIWNINFEEDVI